MKTNYIHDILIPFYPELNLEENLHQNGGICCGLLVSSLNYVIHVNCNN